MADDDASRTAMSHHMTGDICARTNGHRADRVVVGRTGYSSEVRRADPGLEQERPRLEVAWTGLFCGASFHSEMRLRIARGPRPPPGCRGDDCKATQCVTKPESLKSSPRQPTREVLLEWKALSSFT
jgi:hypothetical protein